MIEHIMNAFTRTVSKNSLSQVDGHIYICPMHPEVKSTSMGKCPECGMFLKTVDNNAVAKTMKEGDSHDESAQKHGCC